MQEKQEIIAMILVKIGGEIQSDLKREEEFLSNVASRRTMTPSEFMNFSGILERIQSYRI